MPVYRCGTCPDVGYITTSEKACFPPFFYFYTMINVSFALFPNYGSHYDPAVAGPIAAIAALIVIFLWGPKTWPGTDMPDGNSDRPAAQEGMGSETEIWIPCFFLLPFQTGRAGFKDIPGKNGTG